MDNNANKPPTASKRSFRYQLRLSTFLFLVSLLGVGAGIWMAWIQPVKDQWAAIAPLLEKGARVETSPTGLPDWITFVLPVEKSENIEALFYNYRMMSNSDDLKCLARLPHLKRLYLENSSLDDRGVEHIAKCPTIERLAVWGNLKVTNQSAGTFANLPNLKLLDVKDTGMNWRSLGKFNLAPELKLLED